METDVIQDDVPEEPDHQDERLVNILFPGYLANLNDPLKALDALGGVDAVRTTVAAVQRVSDIASSLATNISQAQTQPQSEPASTPSSSNNILPQTNTEPAKSVAALTAAVPPLTLTLRPGDASSTSNIESSPPRLEARTFLVRMWPPAQGSEQQPFVSSRTQLLGRVSHTIAFVGIADWQYLGDRTLNAASRHLAACTPTNATLQPGAASQNDLYANAPNRIPVPRSRRSEYNRAWRPVRSHEARAVRALDIAELIRTGRCDPVPRGVQAGNEVVDVMELCRPWRFSRTGVELAQSEYFFRQHSYERTSITHAPFQLGRDRRSDADRLGSKPWKCAPDAVQVPQEPPSRDALRVLDGRGQAIVPRQVQARSELANALRVAFAERPVWLRRPVMQHIAAPARASFTLAVRLVGYSFLGAGPFQQAWVRYGYDPRAHREARKLQVVEVRLKNPVVLEAVKLQFARVKAPLAECERRHAWPADCSLAQVPTNRHVFVQLCDVDMLELRNIIQHAEYPEQFDPKTGFFTKKDHERIIKSIRKHIYGKSVELIGEQRAKHIVDQFLRNRRARRLKRRSSVLGDELESRFTQPPALLLQPSQVNSAVGRLSSIPARSVPKSSVPAPPASGIVIPITDTTHQIQANSPAVMPQIASNVTVPPLPPMEDDDPNDQHDGDEINFEDVEGFEVVDSEDDRNDNPDADEYLDDADYDDMLDDDDPLVLNDNPVEQSHPT